MKKILITLIITLIGIIQLNAQDRQTYCTITQTDDSVTIDYDREYLNDTYWNAILKDKEGNKIKFKTALEAKNRLSRFAWKVVNYQITDNKYVIIMSHPASWYDFKESREEFNNLMNNIAK